MLFAGIDLGTSGCRIIVINTDKDIHYEDRVSYTSSEKQTPELWWQSVSSLLLKLPNKISKQLASLCVDGTSGTLLLTDSLGKPTSPALMYNDARAVAQAKRIHSIAPDYSGAHGAGSSLSKLLYLLEEYPNKDHKHALHQADWISNTLLGKFGYSDENNCLKLGYDSQQDQWPYWIKSLNFSESLLPKVYPAGQPLGTISADIAKALQLPSSIKIIAGTTDSIAAFIATGTSKIGEAVTSLGSTLTIKMISKQPIFNPKMGVYSHKLGKDWLVGGASNTGGAVLLQYFTPQQIQAMTPQLNPNKLLNLGYYPLPKVGERFPIADIKKEPKLFPRPNNDIHFFQAILEGIANIEKLAYQTLIEFGAPHLCHICTVGGGSNNTQWTIIRELISDAKITKSKYNETAYGVALLALKAI